MNPIAATKQTPPLFPFNGKLQTEVKREAGRLHAEIVRLAESHAERLDDAARALRAVDETRAARDAEITRAATEGNRDPDTEAELALAHERAKAVAAPDALELAIRVAHDAYEQALDAFTRHVRAHVAELIEDKREAAEQAADAYREAHAKARALLEPAEEAWRQVRSEVDALTVYGHEFSRRAPAALTSHQGGYLVEAEKLVRERPLDVLSDSFDTPPIPTREAVADYTERLNPRPVVVAEDADAE